MTEGCLYCIGQISQIVDCTNTCLINSSIQPFYPEAMLFGSVVLSVAFFLATFLFKDNLKKIIGFRLVSLAFLSTAIFTLGLIFNGHFILKNLIIIIPAFGIGSYAFSYLLSFYLIKLSYKPMPYESKNLQRYLFKISRRLRIKVPKIYIFFSKEPKAFVVDGFKKAVFFSDSLIEKLDYKSLRSVLLHELYHIKRHTGMFKNLMNSFTTLNFKLIPVPINELEKYEDEEIDKILFKKYGIDIEKIKSKLWN